MALSPTRAGFLATVYGSPYGSAPPAIVDSALLAATSRVNASIFQSDDQALMYLYVQAAIIMSEHPQATKGRITDTQVGLWERDRMRMLRAATIGLRVF
jgi:hypothetical protein